VEKRQEKRNPTYLGKDTSPNQSRISAASDSPEVHPEEY
jgi:hypothetical protein